MSFLLEERRGWGVAGRGEGVVLRRFCYKIITKANVRFKIVYSK